jgi:anti-sigma factor RsiW
MCNFDKYLIAFVDGELPDNEAAAVEQHISACDDCRACLASYENVSRDFAAYYASVAQSPVASSDSNSAFRWVPYIAAAAAAIVIALILVPCAHQTAQPSAQLAKVAPPAAVETAAATTEPVAQTPVAAKRRAPSRRIPQNATQPPSEPVVQIVIPADAMFPPGALPDGVVYVANLNYANGGAMPGYRLQQ